MSLKKALPILLGATFALAACTGSQKDVQVPGGGVAAPVPQKQDSGLTPPAAGAPGTQAHGPVANGSQQAASTADASITLKKADLAVYGSNLNYVFSYLGQSLKGPIAFDASDNAVLPFPGLPAGKAGTVTLDIFSGTTAELHGSKDSVTLTAGQPTTIQLALSPVAGAGGTAGAATSDLTVNVSVAPSSAGSGIASTGGNPALPPATTTGANPALPPAGTVTASSDPLAGWDGKSFQGNSSWTIVPVSP